MQGLSHQYNSNNNSATLKLSTRDPHVSTDPMNLGAALDLAQSFIIGSVQSDNPHSKTKADQIIQDALNQIGVTPNNVFMWWSYFKHYPQQLDVSVIKKIVACLPEEGTPYFHEIVYFLRSLISKPDSFIFALDPQQLSNLLLHVLLVGANNNVPTATEMLWEDKELRAIWDVERSATTHPEALNQPQNTLIDFFNFLYFAVKNSFPNALKKFSDFIARFKDIDIIDLEQTNWNMKHHENINYLQQAANTFRNPIVARLCAQASSDTQERIKYYKIAADQGDFLAQIELARRGEYGYAYLAAAQRAFGNDAQNIAQDVGEAIDLLEHFKHKDNDPNGMWLLAELYGRQGKFDQAQQHLNIAAKLGHPLAILEKQIIEPIKQGAIDAQQEVAQIAYELSQLFANHKLWAWPQPYKEKVQYYSDLAKKFGFVENDNSQFSERITNEGLLRIAAIVLKMCPAKYKAAALYQIFTATLTTNQDDSENNLRLAKSLLKDEHPDILFSVLQKAADNKVPTALTILVEALIERYRYRIPKQWQPYITAAAEELNYVARAKEHHTDAQIALTHLKDYTYSYTLAMKCKVEESILTPVTDMVTYLAQAANLHGDREAARLLADIYTNARNAEYAKYFLKVPSPEEAEKIAKVYRRKS